MSKETTTDTLAEIEGQAEPQPVQVREGRWRTRGGDIRNIIPTPAEHSAAGRCPWHDAHYYETWYPSGRYHLTNESPLDLLDYLGPIEPEPEQTITPDDVAAEPGPQPVHLQAMVDSQAETIARLNSDIHGLNMHIADVQTLLGDEKRRFAELETLTSDLRAVNAATEKAVNSAVRDKADLQHRLDTVAAEWAVQAETIRGLQTQLEAVKAEVVQVSKDRHALQVELDAREQVPEAVSDRFDQGFEQGTARAVETIAEWLEPLRKGNTTLRAAVLFHLPHIMRTLTGLADND